VSLANRLSAVVPARSNRGCVTCKYVETLSTRDKIAWDEWISEGRSLLQLWEIACSDTDNPLKVSISGMRYHVRHHKASDES